MLSAIASYKSDPNTYSDETRREINQRDNSHQSHRCIIVDAIFRQAPDIPINLDSRGLALKIECYFKLEPQRLAHHSVLQWKSAY